VSGRRTARVRRVAVITGTRAEYGLLKSTMQAIRADPRLELQLVVTGIHLLPKFGHTVNEIVRDGWRIDARVHMQTGSDRPLDQARGLSRGVAGIAQFLQAAKTDIVVVLGDRIEAMAGAIAAVTTGRILAHIHGGDVAPGDFDDPLRHAITKLAHVHLAATREAARRIIRMGECADRVHVVGAPGLDRLREILAAERRGGQRPGYALVVYHAWGRSPEVECRTMTAVLRAAESAGLRRVILYPNTDRGHLGVLRAIDQHRHSSQPEQVEVLRSLPHDDYLRALMAAKVLIGNSSSGIIEAPFAGTPSINVGGRQAGRLAGGPSVIHSGASQRLVRAAIRRALRTRPRPGGRSVYGDGRAGRRIAAILSRLRTAGETVRKRIVC
jgi:UDP-hydrolysing UDP-N-acetyl-D-glucosamine 2-epimerase